MHRVYHPSPQSNLRTDAQRTSSALGLTRTRAAHAPPETVVRRERHMMIVGSGARNVAESRPEFVVSTRGERIVAGRDATAEGIGALHRHAAEHARVSAEGQREAWHGRRAA
jgi:hypothetical protein